MVLHSDNSTSQNNQRRRYERTSSFSNIKSISGNGITITLQLFEKNFINPSPPPFFKGRSKNFPPFLKGG